jgi:hypothetical protein
VPLSAFLLVVVYFVDLLQDSEGEAPIHICAREGLLGLAQTLCAFGCNVDLPNEDGMLPLHLGKIRKDAEKHPKKQKTFQKGIFTKNVCQGTVGMH